MVFENQRVTNKFFKANNNYANCIESWLAPSDVLHVPCDVFIVLSVCFSHCLKQRLFPKRCLRGEPPRVGSRPRRGASLLVEGGLPTNSHKPGFDSFSNCTT